MPATKYNNSSDEVTQRFRLTSNPRYPYLMFAKENNQYIDGENKPYIVDDHILQQPTKFRNSST